MRSINKEQVYINLDTKKAVDLNTHVYVKDVGEVYCNDDNIKKKVEGIRVYNGQDKEMYDYISGTDITTRVLEKVVNIDITIIGGPDVLIEVKGQEDRNQIFHMLKILLVMLVLFFGTGIAIVNFHEDVDMKSTMQKMYYTITGKKHKDPLILTIPLSLGIGLGMFSFFSRIFSFSKRRGQEPGPMELELYVYDKDLEESILHELKSDKKME
ncbi:MAG: hypothetical protein GX329_01830 [Tissierellia bacterium]|nr:hypothetical protein [Tissierellia bacterium]